MEIPSTLIAGDSWTWTDSLSDYPATTWTLKYYLRGPTPASRITLTAAASGTDHVTTAAIAATTDLPTGEYEWAARVTSGTTATTIASGVLKVDGNPANAAADNRTHNRRVYDALQAVIENRATTDQLSLSIAGRSLSRMSWDEILGAFDRYKLLVAKEMGLRPGRVLYRTARA